MPNQRIEIIIKEINYWKSHKLLPDVYCDFLLALYTEGEGTEEIATKGIHKKHGIAPTIQLMTQMVLLLLSIIIINFQSINPIYKIIFLLLSLLITYWMFKKLEVKRDLFFYLSMLILLVFILLISVYISNLYMTNQWLINLVIAFNLIGWFLMALKYQMKSLFILSVTAFGFICIYAFF